MGFTFSCKTMSDTKSSMRRVNDFYYITEDTHDHYHFWCGIHCYYYLMQTVYCHYENKSEI